jgi:hypothetical protein
MLIVRRNFKKTDPIRQLDEGVAVNADSSVKPTVPKKLTKAELRAEGDAAFAGFERPVTRGAYKGPVTRAPVIPAHAAEKPRVTRVGKVSDKWKAKENDKALAKDPEVEAPYNRGSYPPTPTHLPTGETNGSRPMDIIKYWSQCSLDRSDFIHPQDWRQRDLLATFGFASDLIPVPYAGDIRNAKIIFAMTNPGLPSNEVSVIEAKPRFRTALTATLYQQMEGFEFPFMFLDPQFNYHPGYEYWNTRLNKAMEEYGNMWSCSQMEARRVFARGIATLELVPYHSTNYRGNIHQDLPSSNQARVAFKELSKRCLMIVPRSHALWGLVKPTSGVEVSGNVVTFYHQAAMIGGEVRSMILRALSN